MKDHPQVSTVDCECEKDGKIMHGIFQLRFVNGQPCVVYDFQKVAGVQIAKTLTINPEWLKRVDAPTHQYVYSGRVSIPKVSGN